MPVGSTSTLWGMTKSIEFELPSSPSLPRPNIHKTPRSERMSHDAKRHTVDGRGEVAAACDEANALAVQRRDENGLGVAAGVALLGQLDAELAVVVVPPRKYVGVGYRMGGGGVMHGAVAGLPSNAIVWFSPHASCVTTAGSCLTANGVGEILTFFA
jgi:hypothetical protein